MSASRPVAASVGVTRDRDVGRCGAELDPVCSPSHPPEKIEGAASSINTAVASGASGTAVAGVGVNLGAHVRYCR